MKNQFAIFIATGLMASGASGGAGAQGNPARCPECRNELTLGTGLSVRPSEYHGAIGLAAGVLPDYEGSEAAQALAVLPLADIRYRHYVFLKGAGVDVNDGLASAGLTLLQIGHFGADGEEARLLFGPLVRFRSGRETSDNKTLRGLGDRGGSTEVGGFMKAGVGPWALDVTVGQDVSHGHGGVLAAFGLAYVARATPKLTLTPGVSASWAGADYTQSFFGVTAAQAAQSGYGLFMAEAGFKDVGLSLKASYAVSARVSWEGQAGYRRLLGDAADSSLVRRQGSANQIRVLTGLAFHF